MKCHFESKLLWLLPRHIEAITFGSHVFFRSTKEELQSRPRNFYEYLIEHEKVHIEQYEEEGFFKFLVKYLWYNLRYGYQDNPYEIDARIIATRRLAK